MRELKEVPYTSELKVVLESKTGEVKRFSDKYSNLMAENRTDDECDTLWTEIMPVLKEFHNN